MFLKINDHMYTIIITCLIGVCIGFTTQAYAMQKSTLDYGNSTLSDLHEWNVTVKIPQEELSITICPSDNKRIVDFKDEALPPFKDEEISITMHKSKLIETLLPILRESTRKQNGKLHADQAVLCTLKCIIASTGASHTFELKDEDSKARLIRAGDVCQKVEKKICEIEGIKRPDDSKQ